MAEIILHHYPMSTFSEKIRLALGVKDMTYREVITPLLSPKPDQTALTGGYRRAPVMQIGADIYCDTHLILRQLETIQPTPSLYPDHCQGQADVIAWWAENQIFTPCLGFIANVNPELYSQEVIEERRAFGYTLAQAEVRPLFHRYVQQLSAHLTWLNQMLADGRSFLLGETISAADLSVYPSLWYLNQWGGNEPGRWLPTGGLQDWVARVAAFGHGSPRELSAEQAIVIARQATPATLSLSAHDDPSGLTETTPVTVTPDDVGRDPVIGTLVGADATEIVIAREDPRAGAVHVHFPRAGYDVAAID